MKLRRRVSVFSFCLCFALSAPAGAGDLPALPLKVHKSGRYLVDGKDKPFFYLGDTAWELLHRLTKAEADIYLKDRARKGFTVIQTVVLAELDGVRTPNADGALPLRDLDPTKPNSDYFAHVDAVVARAAELGLVIGMLPTWGDKTHTRHNLPGPRIFDDKKALAFGRFIGNRYKDKAVIFILGGDRNAETREDFAVVRAMAKGLKETAPRNLVTYHPRGPGRSSDFFHQDRWLDFNGYQSSHTARDFDSGVFATHDLALKPPKPTMDLEPRYEDIEVAFYYDTKNEALHFDDYDVRQAAYWSLLAGAAGHTYGNGNIWQMYAPGREPVLGARVSWSEAIAHPGATQMAHVRRLFESRPWHKLVPDQSLIASANPPGGAFIRAARASDNSFAFIYSPRGAPFAVHQGKLGAVDVKAWWYDPRYGRAYLNHEGVGTGYQAFTPPCEGRGCDYVLVLDNTAAGFGPPGVAK